MPFRLESLRSEALNWAGHFPLGVDDKGEMKYMTHASIEEIHDYLDWLVAHCPSSFDTFCFRIVVINENDQVEKIITRLRRPG